MSGSPSPSASVDDDGTSGFAKIMDAFSDTKVRYSTSLPILIQLMIADGTYIIGEEPITQEGAFVILAKAFVLLEANVDILIDAVGANEILEQHRAFPSSVCKEKVTAAMRVLNEADRIRDLL